MNKKILTICVFSIIAGVSVVSAQSIPTISPWKTLGGVIQPSATSSTVKVPSLGSSGSPCLSVSSNGTFATTTCGSGGGTPAGSTGNIQFNNGGAFGTYANFATSTLSTVNRLQIATTTSAADGIATSSVLLVNGDLNIIPQQPYVMGSSGNILMGGVNGILWYIPYGNAYGVNTVQAQAGIRFNYLHTGGGELEISAGNAIALLPGFAQLPESVIQLGGGGPGTHSYVYLTQDDIASSGAPLGTSDKLLLQSNYWDYNSNSNKSIMVGFRAETASSSGDVGLAFYANPKCGRCYNGDGLQNGTGRSVELNKNGVNAITFTATSTTATSTFPIASSTSLYLQGLSNSFLATNSLGKIIATSSPVFAPAGSNTQIQFNNSGSFGATQDLTWNSGLYVGYSNNGILGLYSNQDGQYQSFTAGDAAMNLNTNLSIASKLQTDANTNFIDMAGSNFNGPTNIIIVHSGMASFTGGLSLKYAQVTSNYSIGVDDYTLDCTANSFTLTLPTAVGNNSVYNLKNSGNGLITVNATSSQTIDGKASGYWTIPSGANMQVQSTGANWIII